MRRRVSVDSKSPSADEAGRHGGWDEHGGTGRGGRYRDGMTARYIESTVNGSNVGDITGCGEGEVIAKKDELLQRGASERRPRATPLVPRRHGRCTPCLPWRYYRPRSLEPIRPLTPADPPRLRSHERAQSRPWHQGFWLSSEPKLSCPRAWRPWPQAAQGNCSRPGSPRSWKI